MESINQTTSARKKSVHKRRPSYAKIMPISSLLNNLIGSNKNVEPNETSNAQSSLEPLSQNSRVNERSDGNTQNIADLTLNFINHERLDENNNLTPVKAPVVEMNLEKTFLKCVNYHLHDSDTEMKKPNDAQNDKEDDIDRLLGSENDENAPCLICTNKNATKNHFMNILCKKLCNDSCNTSTMTCNSLDDANTHNTPVSNVSTNSDATSDDKDSDPKSSDDGDDDVKSEPLLERANSSRQEFLASMLDSNDVANNSGNSNESHLAPLTMENLQQFNHQYFREKFAIAEALAKTSMMTPPAQKRRLAARKIEMSLLQVPGYVIEPDESEYIPPTDLLMYMVR